MALFEVGKKLFGGREDRDAAGVVVAASRVERPAWPPEGEALIMRTPSESRGQANPLRSLSTDGLNPSRPPSHSGAGGSLALTLLEQKRPGSRRLLQGSAEIMGALHLCAIVSTTSSKFAGRELRF